MSENEDKALTRRECERCPLHTEVDNLKSWVKGIDTRQWAIILLLIGNLLATVLK